MSICICQFIFGQNEKKIQLTNKQKIEGNKRRRRKKKTTKTQTEEHTVRKNWYVPMHHPSGVSWRSRIYSHFLFGKLFLIEQFISFEYVLLLVRSFSFWLLLQSISVCWIEHGMAWHAYALEPITHTHIYAYLVFFMLLSVCVLFFISLFYLIRSFCSSFNFFFALPFLRRFVFFYFSYSSFV